MGYRHLPTRRAAVKRELKIDTTTSKKKAAYAIRSRREFQLRMGLTQRILAKPADLDMLLTCPQWLVHSL